MCLGLRTRCTQYPDGTPHACDPRMQAQRDAELKAELEMGLEIIPTGEKHLFQVVSPNITIVWKSMICPDRLGTSASKEKHTTKQTVVFLCIGLFHQANASRYLLEEYWTQPGSMESAVELVRQEGWAGLGLDNEASAQSDARLPGLLASFIGNLSTALHAAGFRLVIDVTSTWHGNIAGPEYLPLYGRAAAPSTVFMDMATYFNGRPNGMSMAETLAKVRKTPFLCHLFLYATLVFVKIGSGQARGKMN